MRPGPDSPAPTVAGQLHLRGAQVTVYDPKGNTNARQIVPLSATRTPHSPRRRAPMWCCTPPNGPSSAGLDPARLGEVVAVPQILGGRNALDPALWRKTG